MSKLVERLRIGEAEAPLEKVWVQNLRAHFESGMFSRQLFPEWNDIFLQNVNELLSAASEAAVRIEELEAALTDIAEATDPDNPESYRCDDREGCLDTVQAIARSALTEQPEVKE